VSEIPFQLEGTAPPVNIRQVLDDKLPQFVSHSIASVKETDRVGKRKYPPGGDADSKLSEDSDLDSQSESDSDSSSSVSGFDDLLGSGSDSCN
jgi:hypothetical protein